MKQKKTLYPGNDANQFITALNKAYVIHVTPELATYPSLKEEFVKAAQCCIATYNYTINIQI